MNRFEKAILRMLLKNGNEVDKFVLINSFPTEKLSKANDALQRLIQLRFATMKYVNGKHVVVLPKLMEEEALIIVDPDFKLHKQNTPKNELIPRTYISEPFHKFEGEKQIHGSVSEYWLCRKKKDKDFVSCFIFNADQTWSSLALGSLFDASSLVSRYIEEIDRIFQGRTFFKRELVRKLPRVLTRNRQPIKAVTEYLIIEGYLERIGETSKFKRTGKVHRVDSLDRVRNEKDITMAKPIPCWSVNGKPTYYYTEEEGLYPNFS